MFNIYEKLQGKNHTLKYVDTMSNQFTAEKRVDFLKQLHPNKDFFWGLAGKYDFYTFKRMRDGREEIGITAANCPEMALSNTLGSHPEKYGITKAIVYILMNEDDEPSNVLEWPYTDDTSS